MFSLLLLSLLLLTGVSHPVGLTQGLSNLLGCPRCGDAPYLIDFTVVSQAGRPISCTLLVLYGRALPGG